MLKVLPIVLDYHHMNLPCNESMQHFLNFKHSGMYIIYIFTRSVHASRAISESFDIQKIRFILVINLYLFKKKIYKCNNFLLIVIDFSWFIYFH